MSFKRPTSFKVTVVVTFLIFILGFCCNCAFSRPQPMSYELIAPRRVDFDYEDYPEFLQGTRRKRFAFPFDVQNTRCQPGYKLHSSGYGCVPEDIREDDYSV